MSDKSKRPPWERGLKVPVVVDEELLVEWGPVIRPLLAVVGNFPDSALVCPHNFAEAKAERFFNAWSCVDHSYLLCAACFGLHLTNGEQDHSSTCVAEKCERYGTGSVELLVTFDRCPVFSHAAQDAARAKGGRLILGRVCKEHDGNYHFIWPEVFEPQDQTS
jgi:hypothetical protein